MKHTPATKGLELVRNPLWEEAAWWRHCAARKDDRARQALFEKYLPLAKNIAASQFYRRRSDNYEMADLEQLAIEALLSSIDRFDPMRRVPFSAFARPRILGNISDGVASMSELGRQVRFHQNHTADRMKSLKADLVDDSKKSIDKLRELTVGLALGMMLEGTGLYVDEAQCASGPDGYESLVWKNMTKKLDFEIDNLPDPHSFIVRQHYQNEISFTQIARILDLTKGRVSQLHRKAIELLRKRIGRI